MPERTEQVALITGGVRGQGAAHAEAPGSTGMRVVLADIHDVDGSKTAVALNGENLPVRYTHLDVSDEAAWAKAIADD